MGLTLHTHPDVVHTQWGVKQGEYAALGGKDRSTRTSTARRTDVFAIELLEQEVPGESTRGRIGRSFHEEFEASLTFWSADDYPSWPDRTTRTERAEPPTARPRDSADRGTHRGGDHVRRDGT